MKKLMVIALTLSIFISLSLIFPSNLYAQGKTSIVLELEKDISGLQAGDSFTVRIQAANAVDLFGVQYQLNYDPAMLQIADKGIHIESSFSAYGSKVNKEQGIIVHPLINLAPSEQMIDRLPIAEISFTIIQKGITHLALSKIKVVNQNLQQIEGNTEARLRNIFNVAENGSVNLPEEDAPQLSADAIEMDTAAADERTGTTVKVNGLALAEALSSARRAGESNKLIIEVKNVDQALIVQIPADVIHGAGMQSPDFILSIRSHAASYDLPLDALNLAAVSQTLGQSIDSMNVNIRIEQTSQEAQEVLAANAAREQLTVLAAPVDFEITVEANGKSVKIDHFNSYVTRTIEIPSIINTSSVTGVYMNPETKQLVFAPSTFSVRDGKTIVKITRPGNSTYAVVKSTKRFADLDGHWAEADIQMLGSKLVLNGMKNNHFEPNAKITRAEFAAILVRALGRSTITSGSPLPFKDVPADGWFTQPIAAAVSASLIAGFEDGKFKPNEYVTREQISVMIHKAMKLVDGDEVISPGLEQALSAFNDSPSISSWAKSSVMQTVKLGIMQGKTFNRFAPSEHATRAEAAVIVKRLLLYLHFMN